MTRDTEFAEDCDVFRELLAGPARRAILDAVSGARTFERSLIWLRDGLRAHRFQTAAGDFSLAGLVKRWDSRARQNGFHLLHDWDGKADRFLDDTIPVEIANLARTLPIPETPAARRHALAVILDFEFLYDLTLLAVGALDQARPDEALRAVGSLLAELQGPQGSGHRFARDPATLIIVGTSHFEPDTTAYDRLRAKIARLDMGHRLEMALAHAPVFGCHLGFGLEVTCAGDLKALRDDNVPDYPWLCDALVTLLEASTAESSEVSRGDGRKRILDALFSGLSADPHAFTSRDAPEPLVSVAKERESVRSTLEAHRDDLRAELEARLPVEPVYSPLCFSFNFPHNLVKGLVVDSILRGTPGTVTLNDLLEIAADPTVASARREAARTLMSFALASPDEVRGRPHPAIVYDTKVGLRAFERARRAFGVSAPS